MQPSRFNIVAPVRGTDRHYVVNLLSGQADLLSAEEVRLLTQPGQGYTDDMIGRGYVVDPAEEDRRYRQAYLDFLDGRDDDEVQLFYVPSYACNFDCSYCYQKSYATPKPEEQTEVIDAFFRYVDRAFASRKKYITLFGGEPLLPSDAARRTLRQVVDGTKARDLDLAIVTNGYHLESYMDELSRARIRELQVTLDGPQVIHDHRRHLVGGQPTFAAIVRGIEAALSRGIPINLRTVIDRDNLPFYVELAEFAMARGWTENPQFKTQIGRNYELHECQTGRERLYDRLELYEDLYRIALFHPRILGFRRPAFSVARHLSEKGKLPNPLFDACPGTKTEWAFDYTGHIYGCTATVGKAEESLGRFYPEVHLDQARVESWSERDVLAIERCKGCNLQLACGGGCGAVAKNRSGTVKAPDCRPIEGLLALGLGLYFAPPPGHGILLGVTDGPSPEGKPDDPVESV